MGHKGGRRWREGLGHIAVHQNLLKCMYDPPPGGHARGYLIYYADQLGSYNVSKKMGCV